MINTSVLVIMELLGTIAFSCSGAMVAVSKKLDMLGVVVLGVITAVGGGLLRDMMVCEIPSILKEHIYACASLIGALLYTLFLHINLPHIGFIASAAVVIIIRVLSKKYDWNLPQSLRK